jgi:tetratricopeptide (TPR) repeat protein
MVRYFAGSERTSRAVALIEKGDFDGARHELDIAYRLNSHDVEPVINTYTRLVKLGKNELADEVFAPFESALKKQIQSWPEDAMTLNNLAWMYAKCDIKLNEALELSTKSTSLVPNSAVYLDTLAEVHYRRGEVDAAISTMRECVKLDPRAKGYRKNLVRFSSGKE